LLKLNNKYAQCHFKNDVVWTVFLENIENMREFAI